MNATSRPFVFITGLMLAFCLQLTAASNSGMVKLTQYDRSEYCDLAAGPDDTWHSVFTDQPAHDKPHYLYYRASTDGGKTWSQPVNLSDDESGNGASFARLVVDGRGRLYAIWKYVSAQELLDGPGGHANGRLVFRCLDGGTWSKRILLGDDKIPSYSWFAAVDSHGVVQVIWSQTTKDAVAAMSWSAADYANYVRQATLDGANVPVVKDLIVPKPLLTKEEQAQIKAAGKYPKYEDMTPKKTGLINLRGFVDDHGIAHFVAEYPGIQDGPSSQQTGRQIVVWDGQKLTPVYSYEKYKTYNNFNNPPALLVDSAGKMHLVRLPEKAEKPCVRDYPVEGTELGDFTNIVEPRTGPGAISNWQTHQLPGGRMAVTVSLSQKGGYDPDDTQVYISYSQGAGKWSEPVTLNNNRAKKESFSKDTTPGNSVAAVYSYRPRFAAMAAGKSGKVAMLLIDSENSITGLTGPALTSSGSIVSATGTIRVENPAVFFVKF